MRTGKNVVNESCRKIESDEGDSDKFLLISGVDEIFSRKPGIGRLLK